jgi:putative phosphoesterase
MRVAFLSDIHANFPALCRALEVAQRNCVDRVICVGDIVGHGPHPTEVVRLLMEQRIQSTRGNVDRKVLALLESPKKLKRRLTKKAQAPAAWAALALGEAERAWLARLPSDLRFAAGGADVWVVHGSPLSDTDYIFPSLTKQALVAKLGEARPHLLVCGHSHIPFVKRIDGVCIANCGSVGRPVDGDPRGAFALCDFQGKARVRCRIMRFAYSVEPLIADLKAREARGVQPYEYRAGTKTNKDENG